MSSSSSRPWLERYQSVFSVLLILAILGGVAVFVLRRPGPTAITIIPPEPTSTPAPTETPAPSPTPGPLEVYVTGAVRSPQSLVTLPYGSRVRDAIEAAGGFADDADLDRVNLADILRDGDQVHVYAITEPETALATPNDSGIVYINQATAEELEQLPRIGPAMAQRIIDYRDENGPFTEPDDLLNISGIGPATLEQITPLISFELR